MSSFGTNYCAQDAGLDVGIEENEGRSKRNQSALQMRKRVDGFTAKAIQDYGGFLYDAETAG